MKTKLLFLSVIATLFLAVSANAQEREKDYNYHFAVSGDIELVENLELNIEPEFRFDKSFNIDKYLLNGGVSYSLFNRLSFGAAYRLILQDNDDVNKISVFHRLAYEVNYKENFGNFAPSVRLRYNNYTSKDITDEEFLRYRAKLEYKISKINLKPYVSTEFFQECNHMNLSQIRYSIGATYSIDDKRSIVFDYEIDYDMLKPETSNTFTWCYKLKF